MTIEEGKVVSIAYVVTEGDDDAVIDTADAQDPLEYLHGPTSGIIPGLLSELRGRNVGDHISLALTPEQAYGPRDDSKIRKVPVRRFAKQNVQVGARLYLGSGDEVEAVVVLSVQGDYATVDPNHPMAGKHLKFEVDVVNIRDARPEELEHGHPHREGEHHH